MNGNNIRKGIESLPQTLKFNLSLKYQRFTPLGCYDIRIRKVELVAKTQFFWFVYLYTIS